MSNVDCTDCAKVTAKTLANVGANSSGSCLSVGDVCNPIKDELTPSENERLSSWYAGLHIVPYMGEDNESLKLFSRLRNLSPTQSACVQSIKDYALGGEFTVERKRRTGFAGMAADVSDAEANTFIDFLETFTDGEELLRLANQSYDNLQETGNSWVQVILTTTAGVRSAKIIGHDQQHIRFKYTPLGSPRMAYISQEWSSTWLRQNPPVLVPIYPNFGDMGDGVVTTLIHKANLPTNREWYGVPPSMASIYFQWLEVMRGDYTQKEYGNGFTGKHFVEFEADHNSSDYNQIASSFRQVFTRSGDARSLVLRQRSVNQKPATIHSFAQNTDEKFQSFVSSDCEAQIVKSNNWDGALIGMSKSGRLGNSQELNRLYRWKYQTVVKPWQNRVTYSLNLAIDIAAEWMGREDMKAYSLGLTNPMQDLLDQEAEAAQGQSNTVEL